MSEDWLEWAQKRLPRHSSSSENHHSPQLHLLSLLSVTITIVYLSAVSCCLVNDVREDVSSCTLFYYCKNRCTAKKSGFKGMGLIIKNNDNTQHINHNISTNTGNDLDFNIHTYIYIHTYIHTCMTYYEYTLLL